MARQIVAGLGQTADDRIIGWLVWWTLRGGEYKVDDLKKAAAVVDIPDYIYSRIKGRDLGSAWFAATNLGKHGYSIPSSADVMRKMVVREAYPDAPSIRARALVVETTQLSSGATKDKVTSKTAAILELDWARRDISVQWAEWLQEDQNANSAARRVVQQMNNTMLTIEGRMNEGRIRTALQSWLRTIHRVSVRGTGGVYFIPATANAADRLKTEQALLRVREWLDVAIDSPFSVVALNKAGAHSIDDFTADAVAEIRQELTIVAKRLDDWEANEAMNAGSKMSAAKTQIAKLEALAVKAMALKQALGDEIGVVDEMLSLLQTRSSTMAIENTQIVTASKAARRKSHPTPFIQEKMATAAAKKAGTAKERAGRKTV